MAEATDKKKKKKLASGRHLSAIKRWRQSEKRAAHNRAIRSTLKTSIKRVIQAAEKKDKKEAQEALRSVASLLAKAAQKQIVKSRYASRHTGRLSSLVHRI